MGKMFEIDAFKTDIYKRFEGIYYALIDKNKKLGELERVRKSNEYEIYSLHESKRIGRKQKKLLDEFNDFVCEDFRSRIMPELKTLDVSIPFRLYVNSYNEYNEPQILIPMSDGYLIEIVHVKHDLPVEKQHYTVYTHSDKNQDGDRRVIAHRDVDSIEELQEILASYLRTRFKENVYPIISGYGNTGERR